MDKEKHFEDLRFLILDVDGTLTDGKIYMADSGELFKVFDIKDGCGIKELLIPAGILPVIITARSSRIVENRCKELNITDIYQGCRDKLRKLDELLEVYSTENAETYTYANCAYVGDDIVDLQCMKPIKAAGGLTGCPADAAEEVKAMADFVSSKGGGQGAVREFIEWMIKVRCAVGARGDLGRPKSSPKENRDNFMAYLKD